MKFNIITLGCKVNTYESNFINESLVSNGFSFCEDIKSCNVIIINTCTVTDTSDKKCLKMVRRVRRENPNAILVVCGCSVQNDISKYQNMGINILLGNKDKSKIVSLINDYNNKKENYSFVDKNRDLNFENMAITKFNHVRAYIKIEDGCDNFCSYCVIPFVRGKVRSKDFDVAIKEANCLADNGYKEIVLTGIHTGAYQSNSKDLSDLIEEISKIDKIKRIRLSSVEITELNDKFINVLKTNNKLCNHLHIPLQSGSDEILKIMNRKYDLKYFEDKINEIRKVRPDISITTDVIVGHNFETDALFDKTYNFCKKINFAKIHAFPFSKRTGTKSSLMTNEVNENVKHERCKKLIELSNSLEKDYYNKFKGKKLDVLIEQVKDNKSIGHTSNYLKVILDDNLEINKFYEKEIK